jgi:hypothetical protein
MMLRDIKENWSSLKGGVSIETYSIFQLPFRGPAWAGKSWTQESRVLIQHEHWWIIASFCALLRQHNDMSTYQGSRQTTGYQQFRNQLSVASGLTYGSWRWVLQSEGIYVTNWELRRVDVWDNSILLLVSALQRSRLRYYATSLKIEVS